MDDPVAFFRAVAAENRRCFWLDGGGAREWSGRRSIIGWLDDDDVSLSWSAARREVTRHAGGTTEVVGDDVFAVLEALVVPGEQWFGYLGAASRTDLPATPDPVLPDAVWMRPRAVRVFEHAPAASWGGTRPRGAPPPGAGGPPPPPGVGAPPPRAGARPGGCSPPPPRRHGCPPPRAATPHAWRRLQPPPSVVMPPPVRSRTRTPPRSRRSRSTCTPATPTRSTSPTAARSTTTSTR